MRRKLMWNNNLCASGPVAFLFLLAASLADAGPMFSGVPISPGATVRADVPLSPLLKSYASEAGTVAPATAVAVLAVPPGFDPQKNWPVLVVISTSDFQHLNRDDLVRLYRESAFAEGWVLLAGDGIGPARKDTTGWRAAMTLAAVDALHRSFPGSNQWPVAVAGYSGGAKRAGLIAPLLALSGCRMIGIYLTGINEDRLSDGYRQYKPGANFLRTPVYISSGASDPIATPQQQMAVQLSMQKNGCAHVRLESFPEGHVVKRTHLREALRWFRHQ